MIELPPTVPEDQDEGLLRAPLAEGLESNWSGSDRAVELSDEPGSDTLELSSPWEFIGFGGPTGHQAAVDLEPTEDERFARDLATLGERLERATRFDQIGEALLALCRPWFSRALLVAFRRSTGVTMGGFGPLADDDAVLALRLSFEGCPTLRQATDALAPAILGSEAEGDEGKLLSRLGSPAGMLILPIVRAGELVEVLCADRGSEALPEDAGERFSAAIRLTAAACVRLGSA